MGRKKTTRVVEEKTPAILHGECALLGASIPAEAMIEKVKGAFIIVAPSETTGNHHVIDMVEGVQFFTHDKQRYMRNTKPTNIRCLMEHRHDTVTVPPGEWFVGVAQEYDYFEQARRNVRD